jgi:mRNA-degrading endonuclease RelE of RelBE toxin-antitoxin system
MNYKIELSENFKKEAKKLSEKYPSLRTDHTSLFKELEKIQLQELHLVLYLQNPFGYSFQNKGKSGGVRVMSFIKITDTTVLFFYIHNKGDKDSISDKKIEELIKNYI